MPTLLPAAARLPGRWLTVLVAAGVGAAAVAAQPPQATAPSILDASRHARAVLERAIAAHGGASVIDAVATIHLVLDGEQTWRHQSRRVDPPFDRSAERNELWLDLPNGRAISSRQATYPGGAHRHTGFITDGEHAFSLDFRRATHRVASYPPASTQTGHLYALPPFVLRDLQATGRSLRSLGRVRLSNGAEVDAVVGVAASGGMVTAGFDPDTGRLRALLGVGNHVVDGEGASETEFLDYRETAGLVMPGRRVMRTGGLVIRDQRYVVVEPGRPTPADRLRPPVGSRDVGATPPPEPVRTLGPDVWMIGGGTAVLAVAFRDHVVVVDAPPNAATVLERLATLAPGKPVRYVVPTHHHDDHAAGVGDYVRHGATVVTTGANRGSMERIGGEGTSVEIVDGSVRLFEDGTRRLEIHAIGPGPHAEDMFVAWIPALGVLYQADLIDVDASGDTPPGTNNETTLHFASWLARQRLNVRMFAGTHGSLPTPRAFEALIAMPVLPMRR